MRKLPAEQNWELRELGRAVGSFLARNEPPEQAKSLMGLVEKLAGKTGEGGSHLIAGEVAEFSSDAQSLVSVGLPEENLPLVVTVDGKLYFRRHYEYEREVAGKLSERLKRSSSMPPTGSVEFFSHSLAPQVDRYQALAVGTAMLRDLVVLTGGPGTGKTRTIVMVLAALLQAEPNLGVALAAPTGKAAFRMRESVLQNMNALDLPESIRDALSKCAQASTLHRLLGSKAGSVDFLRDAKKPLPHDVIVVDEASMVDLPLMAKLCSALREKTKLILVGDADQLAPVQGGAVFNGLVRSSVSNRFCATDLSMLSGYSEVGEEAQGEDFLAGSLVSLSLSHRRAGSPSAAVLGDLCDAVRDGKGDDALQVLKEGGDSVALIESLEDSSLQKIIQDGFTAMAEATDPSSALDSLAGFRILCAHNEGAYGVESWNHTAKELFPVSDDRPLPIVVGSNDYSVRLFNGDDGIILGARAHFSGEEGLREVPRSRLPSHSLAYAISIHRSQGSEYKRVLIILPPKESKLLTRELLYVAASRAKEAITFVGSSESLLAAIANEDDSRTGVTALLE